MNEAPDYYVYILVDPRNRVPFYVGKGKGKRCDDHLADWKAGRISNVAKHARIGSIVAAGMEPRARILRRGLSERDALNLEGDIIRALGIQNLTNLSRGEQSEKGKATALARAGLIGLARFDDWFFEAGESLRLWEMALFHRVRAELFAMAFGDFETEVTVRL